MDNEWFLKLKKRLDDYQDRILAVKNIRTLYGMKKDYVLRYEYNGRHEDVHKQLDKSKVLPDLVLRKKLEYNKITSREFARVFTNYTTGNTQLY